VRPDDATEILGLLTNRRQQLVEARITTVNRLHEVLCQLIPGKGKEEPARLDRPHDAVVGATAGGGRQSPQPARAGLHPGLLLLHVDHVSNSRE
jgi:hypothetical protein